MVNLESQTLSTRQHPDDSESFKKLTMMDKVKSMGIVEHKSVKIRSLFPY